MASHPVLFLPGPTEVEKELREILARPIIGHRSPAFVAIVLRICEGLRALFLTRAHVLFESCPATALMEAAVRNLVRERVLHLVCGAFGERWLQISRACGRRPESLEVEWGRPNLPDDLRRKLRADGPFEAVAITFNETSTGVCNPLRDLAAVVREVAPTSLVLVDAVSGAGGAELRFDDWGLDLVFAGTQKCLALAPGITVYALSERAVDRAAKTQDRGYFWDFARAAAWMAEGQVSATPNIPLVYALDRQLERIAAEGIENRWRRHTEMQAEVAAWAARAGFRFLAEPAYRSPTVSALFNSGHRPAELLDRALRAGFVIAAGQGKLESETFRIGHLGDHTPERLRALLHALS